MWCVVALWPSGLLSPPPPPIAVKRGAQSQLNYDDSMTGWAEQGSDWLNLTGDKRVRKLLRKRKSNQQKLQIFALVHSDPGSAIQQLISSCRHVTKPCRYKKGKWRAPSSEQLASLQHFCDTPMHLVRNILFGMASPLKPLHRKPYPIGRETWSK